MEIPWNEKENIKKKEIQDTQKYKILLSQHARSRRRARQGIGRYFYVVVKCICRRDFQFENNLNQMSFSLKSNVC